VVASSSDLRGRRPADRPAAINIPSEATLSAPGGSATAFLQ
jgi:hypothetical protein